jgi:hypothetical protein
VTPQSSDGQGQGIARRLLDSLEANQPRDWGPFQAAYQSWLLHVADGCRTRYPTLAHHFDSAEELVNDFLAEKVYPDRQTRLMFTAPANGECPLRPRLAASLTNYCVDLVRSPTIRRPASSSVPETAASPAPRELPDYEDVVALLKRQHDAIRDDPALEGGAPYRAALLLRLRLDWAGVFDGLTLHQSESMGNIELTLPLLESLTAWTNEETETWLGESLHRLGSAWEALRPLLLAAVGRRLSASEVAAVLRVPRDLWDQWISRGRRRLKQDMGDEYAAVFPLWP